MIRMWVKFWYYLFTSFHFCFNPSRSSSTSSRLSTFLCNFMLTFFIPSTSEEIWSCYINYLKFVWWTKCIRVSSHSLFSSAIQPLLWAALLSTECSRLRSKQWNFYSTFAHKQAFHGHRALFTFCERNRRKNSELNLMKSYLGEVNDCPWCLSSF